MKEIYRKLHQFSTYIPPMDFTLHQYLLASDPAILFATGTAQQARAIVPEVRRILGGRALEYIFVSHVESDEAGGLFVFQDAYPEVVVLCGRLAARELPGYGYEGKVEARSEKDTLKDGELDLAFADYPAEVHDQNGLVCYERNSGVVYSADLFLRRGNGTGSAIRAAWDDEVERIPAERVADDAKRERLKGTLRTWSPSFVAVGHGYCLDCERRP